MLVLCADLLCWWFVLICCVDVLCRFVVLNHHSMAGRWNLVLSNSCSGCSLITTVRSPCMVVGFYDVRTEDLDVLACLLAALTFDAGFAADES